MKTESHCNFVIDRAVLLCLTKISLLCFVESYVESIILTLSVRDLTPIH